MTTGTTAKGWPFPNGDDPTLNGDNMIKALAQFADAHVPFAMAAGTVTFPDVAAASVQSVQVTFPVGRFTVGPVGLVTPYSGTPQARNAGCSPPNTTYLVAYFGNFGTGAVTAPTAAWLALQFGAAAAPGLLAADLEADTSAGLLICQTDGCANYGVEFPAAPDVDAAQCGACGNPIAVTVEET